MDNTEVFTMSDKAQRDRMFEELRQSDDPLERQVVKFSGARPILDADGEPDFEVLPNYAGRMSDPEDPKPKHYRIRWLFESTWSVAYPRT
jgi:hypothetical protein